MTKIPRVTSTGGRGVGLSWPPLPYLTGSCLWLAAGLAQATAGGGVKVANPLAAARAAESITLNLADLRRR